MKGLTRLIWITALFLIIVPGSILGIYGELHVGKPEWYPDAGNYCGYILHGTGAQRVNNNKLSPNVYSIG